VDDWLTRARDALATEAGFDPATLELSCTEAKTLLDLARIPAHDSGERINAPLLCYLVGRAQGSRGLDELAEAVRRSTS
jgi:uncharacterized protein DUF6457